MNSFEFLTTILPYPTRAFIQQFLWRMLQPPPEQMTYQRLASLFREAKLSPADAADILEGRTLPRRLAYRHFTRPKKDGTLRHLAEPGSTLKAAQNEIKRLYLDRLTPHPAAMAFRKGMSIADHAWSHAGGRVIITGDIQDFFPNTAHWRVRDFFEEHVGLKARAELFTRLTTYQGGLPQGAPSSPPLSNLVNIELDKALARRAAESSGRYTRYADDLAFSWPDGFAPPSDLEHAVRGILRRYGYALHQRKGWQVWDRRDEPEVTGLVLTRRGGVDLPDSMKAIMRELKRSQAPEDRQRLVGYEGYRGMIERPS